MKTTAEIRAMRDILNWILDEEPTKGDECSPRAGMTDRWPEFQAEKMAEWQANHTQGEPLVVPDRSSPQFVKWVQGHFDKGDWQ